MRNGIAPNIWNDRKSLERATEIWLRIYERAIVNAIEIERARFDRERIQIYERANAIDRVRTDY
jgi:hypothetical protein